MWACILQGLSDALAREQRPLSDLPQFPRGALSAASQSSIVKGAASLADCSEGT